MNNLFFNNMSAALYKAEYRPLNILYASSDNSLSPYGGFIRSNGSMLCLVHLLRIDLTGDKTIDFFNYISSQSSAFINKNNIRNAVNVFIFIGKSEEIPESIYSLCQSSDIGDLSDFMCIKWIACTDKSRLIVMGKQPDKIGGIEKLVWESLSICTAQTGSEAEAAYGGIKPVSRPYKSKSTLVTLLLIGINIFVFCLMYIQGDGSQDISTLIAFGAIHPKLIFDYGEYYRLFTSMFLHIGIAHLTSNCLSLYIAGSRVERYFGKPAYILIYLMSGFCGSLASAFLSGSVAAGASGAIFGLFGAIAAYTFFRKISMQGINLYSVIFLVIINLGNGFLTPGIDNFAHIGGFFGGLAVSSIYLLIEGGVKNAKRNLQ